MKNKKIIFGLAVLVCILMCSACVIAISMNLEIKGEQTVTVGGTINLTADYWVGNDVINPDDPNGGIGEVSREEVTSNCEWTSSNESIATVDNTGLVRGIAEGSAIITAKYDRDESIHREATREITVVSAATATPEVTATPEPATPTPEVTATPEATTPTPEVTATPEPATEPVKGDINGDGQVTVTDLLILKQFIVGLIDKLP